MQVSAISLIESKQEGDYNFPSITAGNEIELTANPGEVRDCKLLFVCVCGLCVRGCVCLHNFRHGVYRTKLNYTFRLFCLHWRYSKFKKDIHRFFYEMNSQTWICCEYLHIYIVDLLMFCSTVTRTPGIKDVIQSKTFLIVSGVSALLLIMLVVMICVVQRRRRRHKGICQPLNLSPISWLY